MNDSVFSRLPFGLGRLFYGWWVVAACFSINIYIAAFIYYGFTAFFDPLVNEFGWSYTQISLAVSLRGLEMSILAPIVGLCALALMFSLAPQKSMNTTRSIS